MRRTALIAPLFVALAAAAPAHAWLSAEGYRVEDRGNGTFEVLTSPGQSATESWCAAGAYVSRFLGQGPTADIWRVTPPPRRAGEGVVFSLSPQGAAPETGLLVLLDASSDNSLSAAFAESLCAAVGPIRAVEGD